MKLLSDLLNLKLQITSFLNKIEEYAESDDKPYETRNSQNEAVVMDKKLIDQWKTIDNYYQK